MKKDVFDSFRINHDAFRYFGIICFTDIPGYFPQLDKTEQQNKNLKNHIGAVLMTGSGSYKCAKDLTDPE
jgi:hypothetical protein